MDDADECDQVTQVIGYHPRYRIQFLHTQNYIMKGDGPLPFPYRYYLAIIAAARHQCPYLVNRYEKEFINHGGNSDWLNGLDYIPAKLRDIYDINKILAHRPWLLRKEHVERLTKGKNSWSLSEVVHAMVLLSHFHSLSSFVFSCGLTQKLDKTNCGNVKDAPMPLSMALPQFVNVQQTLTSCVYEPHQQQLQKNVLSEILFNRTTSIKGIDCSKNSKPDVNNIMGRNSSKSSEERICFGQHYLSSAQHQPQQHDMSVETLMELMKVLSQNHQECSEAELSNRFKSVEIQTAELAGSTPATIAVPQIISHYVDDACFTYQDFARRESENIPTFRIQDYSWEDHGYSLVNGLYTDMGTFLDDKFRAAYNLTYFTMGGIKNVDTSKFRRAIWNYIQCIFGIRHDDYDYGEVNQLLVRPLKMFIKTACCFPERITTKDYDSVLIELQDSEKVHVNLMIMEARNQAELLYALREIMRYMT